MQILRTTRELKEFVALALANHDEIGFVPTMGALHAGHASLIQKSVSQNPVTIVSTFVNPTQFLAGEDLDKYPKNEASDVKICEEARVSAMFIPSAEELYFDGEATIAAPKNLAEILEGKTRPGHFDGVLRVLNKLFNLVRPTRVYMGKKDAQQLAIVQNFVKTSFLGCEIVPCEIVRESDGLALSSRNAYLSESEKFDALRLSRSLSKAENLIKDGERGACKIKSEMLEILKPLTVDYVAVVDRNFNEISLVEQDNTIILVAANVGNTRLIDNLWI
ncbi:pantoate--beta-alanine ligase [uncultured Campylobacter sp.]|jgi:pantoate--beta-alanine ligase|uniref:pantoate--beta-alanine ligase n=1 Tax=uncultured Campylobacter sp. TaxID=218934 RepID=UPI0025DC3AC6|nr:pantoate--beta-alanine ligase [uncultured Campylobacter sp.]